MPSSKQHPSLIVILGPTAVGKTAVSLNLAARLRGEIVSADSRLLYRGMDIGTAKPDLAARASVPHYLIDVAEPDETWSLAKFQQAALRAIHDINDRGQLPCLVGGTGQYIKAVCEGWEVPAVKPDPVLRETLERWASEVGREGLHARLAVLDPDAAGQIDLRNMRRTIRALEVILTTGRPFSAQRGRTPPAFRICMLGLIRPRHELYARIDARLEEMIRMGFLAEVVGLLERGFEPELPSLSAIGYREVAAHLRGEFDLEEALRLIRRRTRQFVRRQANWFKSDDSRIHWFSMGPGVEDAMMLKIRAFLTEQ
jgi:tRNA dimethylallyltransferase